MKAEAYTEPSAVPGRSGPPARVSLVVGGIARTGVLAGRPSTAVGLPHVDGAQEMPATVASDLVEQALEEEVEVPEAWWDASGSPSGAAPSGSLAGPWLVTMAVAVLLVAFLRARWAGRSWRGGAVSTSSAAPQDGDPDVIPISRGHPDERPDGRNRQSRPPETLAIPPHVMEILRRSAERQPAVEGGRSTNGEEGEADSASRPHEGGPRGIDVTLPRYDSRREG